MATIFGGAGPESIPGTTDPDTIYGGAGDDTISGLEGDDVLFGGQDNDTLFGGTGNDILVTGLGVDQVFGGIGNDRILIDPAALGTLSFHLDGGSDFDVLEITGHRTFANVTFTDMERVDIVALGQDSTLLMTGATARGLVQGNVQVSLVGDSLSTATLLVDLAGESSLDLSLLGASAVGPRASVSLFNVAGTLTGTELNDTINVVGASSIFAGAGDDTIENLTAGTASQVFRGGAGHDRITLFAGDGTLFGGTGNDFVETRTSAADLFGGSGDDELRLVQTGPEALDGTYLGGAGQDHLVISHSYGLIDMRQATLGGIEEITLTTFSTLGGIVLKASQVGSQIAADTEINFDFGLAGSVSQIEFRMGSLRAFDLSTFAVSDDAWRAQFVVKGTESDQIVTGSVIDDVVTGGGGDDVLRGRAGADSLSGDIGDDRLFGGSGSDLLFGGRGSDDLYGGRGNDLLVGGAPTDRLFGGGGNDTLRIGVYDAPVPGAVYRGGGGVDRFIIEVEIPDLVDLRGVTFAGLDTFEVATFNTFVTNRLRLDAAQIKSGWSATTEVVTTGADSDVVLQLLMGAETELDLSGYSVVANYDVPLTIEIRGDGASETINGADTLSRITGAGGHDDIHLRGFESTARGGTGNDILRSEADKGSLFGGAGDDTFLLLDGSATIRGGTGVNTLDLRQHVLNGASAETVNLQTGRVTLSASTAEASDVQGITRVFSGAGATTLIGADLAETFYGGGGDDLIIGHGGEDRLIGGSGNDEIDGGLGVDRIFGGDGDDLIRVLYDSLPQSGEVYSGGRGVDTLALVSGGTHPAGALNFRGTELGGFEALIVGPADPNETIRAQFTAAQVSTAFAPGTLFTLDGSSNSTSIIETFMRAETTLDLSVLSVASFSGDDRFVTRGNAGTEVIIGSGIKDYLFGGAGDDTLDGHSGDDLIVGGTGRDTLTGGAGIDTFDFNTVRHSVAGQGDVITDFGVEDFLDLSDVAVAATAATGFQMLNIGQAAFGGAGFAELRMTELVVGGELRGTRVQVDTDGDGTTDMAIFLRDTALWDVSHLQLVGVYTLI